MRDVVPMKLVPIRVRIEAAQLDVRDRILDVTHEHIGQLISSERERGYPRLVEVTHRLSIAGGASLRRHLIL